MAADNPIVRVVSGGSGWVTVVDSSGATVTRTGARNWRNNNPGNIYSGYKGGAAEGVVGHDKYGDPVFATYEQGLEAQRLLIFGPTSKYMPLTLQAAMYRYTPPVVEAATGQMGNPEGHINAILAAVPGISRNTLISQLTVAQQQAMLAAIDKLEGYKVGTIAEVIPAAGGGNTTPPNEKPSEEGGATATPSPASTFEPDVQNTGAPIANRLKEYASYIYGLSLHLMTNDQYNKVVDTQTYTTANVLVASAGRYSSTDFPRNEYFSEDFYFEDLNITTIIAPNDVSRNTNAIECNFTLIEPYGFTLMERLLKVADAVKSGNYMDMPYLLQIDFFGMDDTGKIATNLVDQRKRIPIKIIKLDVRVSVKGAEYKITAIPFNHSAYDATTVTTPANFEVTAGSVAEFFQSIEGTTVDPAASSAYFQQQREAAGGYVPPTGTEKPSGSTYLGLTYIGGRGRGAPPLKGTTASASTQSPAKNSAAGKTASGTAYTKVKSYGAAINGWYEAMRIDNKVEINDVYRFEFPTDEHGVNIGNYLFTDKLRATPKRTAMKDNLTPGEVVTMKRAEEGSSQKTYDTSKALFQVNYGTTVEKLLEYIIRTSDYIQNQLVIPEDFPNDPDGYKKAKEKIAKEPLYWFKIVPTVRIRGFDNIRKILAREITYTVVPYKVYNLKIDVGPQGVQLYPVKKYNYIYTGENDDVFDFDISFNAMYYTQVTAYRGSGASLNPTAASATNNYQVQNAPNYNGSGDPPTGTDYNAVMPLVMKPIVQNSKAAATGGATTAKEVASIDLADSLMTNSQADLLSVKLKILGDPDYIKQDDVFYRPPLNNTNIAKRPTSDPRLLSNSGSLVMDNGGVYVQLLFRTPIDIDESTGLMKFDSNYQHSVFSGLYQVLQVTSHFSHGQFTQELDMIRMPRQSAYDYATLGQSKSDARSEVANQPGGKLSPTTPTSTEVTGGAEPQSPAAQVDAQGGNQTAGSKQVPETATDTPSVSKESKDLANVASTADTTAATAANAPQAVPPPPPPPPTLPAGVTQDPVSGNYIYKGVTFGGDIQSGIKAIDTNSTVTYSAVDPVSGTVMTHTVDGAALNAAYSPSGQLQSDAQTAQESATHVQAVLASNPTAFGTVAQGQQVLATRQARAAAAAAAYKASLPGS